MATDLVFVYGSLRRGGVNFPVMAACGGRFRSLAETLETYLVEQGPEWRRLLDRPRSGRRVKGELFRLPSQQALECLDAFEGHPWLYQRKAVRVLDGAQRVRWAWAYFYHPRGTRPAG